MLVPCDECAVDAPQEVSSMLADRDELFARGWHVHKATGNVPGTVLKQEYFVFLDDELWDKQMKNLMENPNASC